MQLSLVLVVLLSVLASFSRSAGASGADGGPRDLAARAPVERTYVFREGDTLWAVARRNDLSVDALLQANPGVDPYTMRVGQTITLPAPEALVPARVEARATHTIQAGDTLSALSYRYRISVDGLLRLNPGLDPYALRVGQRVVVAG